MGWDALNPFKPGAMLDFLSGKGDIKKANKVAKQQLAKALAELGGPEEGTTFFDLIQQMLVASEDALYQGTDLAGGYLQEGYGKARGARRRAYEGAMASLATGQSQAEQRIGAGAAGAVEASLKAQQQALAAMGQQAVSSGLGGATRAAQAGNIAAQTAQGMSGAFAQQSGQLGQIAQMAASERAQTQTQYGQDIGSMFAQEGQQLAGLETGLGQMLAQLYSNQGQMYSQYGQARANLMQGLTHIVPPSPLQTIGQVVDIGAGIATMGKA